MEIWVHRKCEQQFDEIRRTSPQLYAEIKKELREMANAKNPLTYPRVKPMRGCAKYWYRLAIYQPLSVRIIFRFLICSKKGYWYELQIKNSWFENPNQSKRILQVVKVGFRCSVYNKLNRYVEMIK